MLEDTPSRLLTIAQIATQRPLSHTIWLVVGSVIVRGVIVMKRVTISIFSNGCHAFTARFGEHTVLLER